MFFFSVVFCHIIFPFLKRQAYGLNFAWSIQLLCFGVLGLRTKRRRSCRAGHMEETRSALCPSQGAVLHETPVTAACNNLLSLTSNDQCVEILQGFLPSAFIVLSNQSWPAAWAFPQAFLSSLGCCYLGLPPPIMPASWILLLLCPTAVAGLIPLSSPPKNILPQGMWFLLVCLFSVCALCDPPSWMEATGNKFCLHTHFDKYTVTSRW